MRVLRLNKAGQPIGWISYEQAAELYTKDQILWELGDEKIELRGGLNNDNVRSKLIISPIIASEGRVINNCVNTSLTNRTLFRRDQNTCMYCGREFDPSVLTRDHIVPRGQGGPDVWLNVVAACKRCNNHKGCRTPEEANMKLLAAPFKPNIFEWIYLSNRNIIVDQMDFIKTHFNNNRDWVV